MKSSGVLVERSGEYTNSVNQASVRQSLVGGLDTSVDAGLARRAGFCDRMRR